MPSASRLTARIRGVAELIATLPYQLGYPPRRSLVVVLLHEREPDGGPAAGVVGMTARIDLPGPAEEAEVLSHLVTLLRRQRPFLVQLLAYEDADQDSTPVLRSMVERCQSAAIRVDVAVRVRGGRWRRVAEPGGAPPRWRPVPRAADVPAVAELVVQGAGVVADRQELTAWLDRPAAVSQRAVRRALDTGRDGANGLDTALAAWRVLLEPAARRSDRDLSDAELAELVRCLEDRIVRDALLAWLTPGQYSTLAHDQELMSRLVRSLPTSRVRTPWLQDRLVALVPRLPEEERCPLLTVLAVVAWWHGNGTMANLAIERALRVRPAYRLAQLVDQVLDHAIGPPPVPWQRRG